MKSLKFIILFLSFQLSVSCSGLLTRFDAPYSPITDISASLSFDNITNQGFMGGSLPFSAKNISSSPLRENAFIAVRLGTVKRTDIDNTQSVFEDIPEEACYGIIKIKDINTKNLSFSCQFFDADKNISSIKEFSIKENQSVDINNDGFQDLSFYKSTDKRIGFENAMYLTFNSSQENKKTTMFAVLTEQYPNSDYPGGLIGINPSGNFILSKYTTSGERSVLGSFRTGDYVLDSVEGTYKKINCLDFTGSSREVLDTELESIDECASGISYLFDSKEFIDGYDSDLLLSNLSIILKLQTLYNEKSSIDNLNSILRERNLLQKLLEAGLFEDNVDDVQEIINEIYAYSETELIHLNRSFIELLYPELCPKLVVSSNIYTEIIPLASVKFGSSEEETSCSDYIKSRSALTANEYEIEKAALYSKYKKYIEVKKQEITLPKSIPVGKGSVNIVFTNSYLAIGVTGSFNSTWGSVKSTVKGCVYITADTNIDADVSYERDLFNPNYRIEYPIQLYGPVILSLSANVGISVPLKINVSESKKLNYRATFTGLYEAGFDVGLKYGVNWKKAWFVSIPKPYADWSGRKLWNADTISFSSSQQKESVTHERSYARIGAKAHASFGVDISKIVWGDITASTGIYSQFDLIYLNSYLTGKATITPELNLAANAFIGIKDIPFIGQLGKSWSYDIYKYNKPMASYTLFNTKVSDLK